jgi:hypothetical protein
VDVGDVVSESAGNGAMTDRLHFGEGINQTIVLAFLKGLDEHRAIVGSGEVIDFYTHAHHSAELSSRAHGASFDGFILDVVTREKGKRANREQPNHNCDGDNNFVSLLNQEVP